MSVLLGRLVSDPVSFYSEEGKSETTILQLGGFSMTTANTVKTEGEEASQHRAEPSGTEQNTGLTV